MALNPEKSEDGLQVVVFSLEGKALALDILMVQEIIRLVEITPVPNMPPFALGVINLRGKIVPIVNIREKLNLPESPPTAKTCIILIRSGDKLLGFLADDVTEVLTLPEGSVEKPESGPDWIQSDLFLGMAKLPAGLMVIINGDRLLSPKEEKLLQKARAAATPFE